MGETGPVSALPPWDVRPGMTTDRRFCRFSPSASLGMRTVPEDGFCLSAFLVIASEERPGRILLGKLDAGAPWDHLGALDPGRAAAWTDRWMLPSSHLLVGESPDAAARRILAEQTGLADRRLEGPVVGSDVYAPSDAPDRRHWDLEFVYRGTAREDERRPHVAWKELAFVEARTLRPEMVARSQADILALAGVATG